MQSTSLTLGTALEPLHQRPTDHRLGERLGFRPLRNTSGKSYEPLEMKRNPGRFRVDCCLLQGRHAVETPSLSKMAKLVQAGFRGTDDEKRAKLS